MSHSQSRKHVKSCWACRAKKKAHARAHIAIHTVEVIGTWLFVGFVFFSLVLR